MILDLVALAMLLLFVLGVLRGASPARRALILTSLTGVLSAVAAVLLALHQLTQ